MAGSAAGCAPDDGGSSGAGGAPIGDCGNGVREGDEACDGADLGGATCASIIADDATGILGCSPYCMFDTSACSPSVACGDTSGLQKGAPWPTLWGCPSHAGRTTIPGPTKSSSVTLAKTSSNLISPPVVAADGTIYIGGQGGLHAFAADGTELFVAGDGMPYPSTEAAAVLGDDGTIYWSSLSGYLLATRPDGTLAWSTHVAGSDGLVSAPMAGSAAIYVLADQTLRAFDRKQGTMLWSVPTPGYAPYFVAPALARDGTVVVSTTLPDEKQTVTAISPAGAVLFTRVFYDCESRHASPSIAADGTIYVPIAGKLVALRPDGSTRWSVSLDASGGNASVTAYVALIGADGTIYKMSDFDHAVTALHPDGTIAWKAEVQAEVTLHLITGEGRLWLGGDEAPLVIEPDGTLSKLMFPFASSPNYAFSAVTADGALRSLPGQPTVVTLLGK